MIRISSLGFVLLACSSAIAQFEVFPTYESFANNESTMYADFDFHAQKGKTNTTIVIKHNETGEKIEFACSDVWGFRYKDHVFRNLRLGKYYKGNCVDAPLLLQAGDKDRQLWANGPFAFKAVKDDAVKYMELSPGFTSFLTADVNGDFMLAPALKGAKGIMDGGDAFSKDHPELKSLKDCMLKDVKYYYYYALAECISK